MSDPKTGPHGVVIGLPAIYAQVQETDDKVDLLTNKIGELVAVNRRLDSHSATIAEHDQRIDKLEIVQAVLQAQQKPSTPWPSIVTAVAAILSSVVTIGALLVMGSKIAAALS